MSSEKELDPAEILPQMEEPASGRALTAIESGEKGKGSLGSMWELLLQMRVLLPYLARLIPLLDRGLVKAAPDLSEVRKGMQEITGNNRDLSAQLQHQKLQLERIENQLLQLREMAESNDRDQREIAGRLTTLRAWIRALAVVGILSLAVLAVVAVMLSFHPGH